MTRAIPRWIGLAIVLTVLAAVIMPGPVLAKEKIGIGTCDISAPSLKVAPGSTFEIPVMI